VRTASKRDPITEDGHRLEGSECLITAAFSKAWATSPGYWVGVYTKVKGPLRFFWIYRQWAFFKKAGELIADDFVSKPCTTIREVAESFAEQYIRLTVEKEYELSDITFFNEELEAGVRSMISKNDDALAPEKSKPAEANSLRRFKKDQKEREKNTKW
jgi:hypothetical protein